MAIGIGTGIGIGGGGSSLAGGDHSTLANLSYASASHTGFVAASRNINTTAPLTGGGDLSADRTLAISNFGGDAGSGGTKGAVPAPAAGDAEADKFLCADGTWNTLPLSGLLTFFFIDTASDIGGGYKQAKNLDGFTSAAEATVVTAGAVDAQVLASFATNAGFPNLKIVPDGMYHIHMHAKRTAGAGTATLRANVYARTVGGVETLIATGHDANALGTSASDVDITAVQTGPVAVNATDRIVVKFVLELTGGGSTTVTLYYDGINPNENWSRIEMPGPSIDVSTYLPRAEARELLTAEKNVYVRTDGNDSNDGSANDAAHAWLTLQHAANQAMELYDHGKNRVVINLAAGTYSGGMEFINTSLSGYTMAATPPGYAAIEVKGDIVNPENVIITGGWAFYMRGMAAGVYVRGVKFSTVGPTYPAIDAAYSFVFLGEVDFGACTGGHILCKYGGYVNTAKDFKITGGAPFFVKAYRNGVFLQTANRTCTITGTPAFSTAFAVADSGGVVEIVTGVWTGSATGKRFKGTLNGVIELGAQSPTWLPGDAAGTVESGAVCNSTIPVYGFRERLIAARTYYVRTDGNDSNTGLVDSAGGAFLTIQKAVDVVRTLNLAGYKVTIQVRDGTYTGEVLLDGPFVGANIYTPSVEIKGNTVTPANVLINCTNSCFTASGNPNSPVLISNMKLQSSAAFGLWAHDFGYIQFDNLVFGACVIDIYGAALGRITANGNYEVVGARTYHVAAEELSEIVIANVTVTLTSTPTFTTWALASKLGKLSLEGCTFSGGGTGKRYDASLNGVIYTNAAAETYLPGNAAGTLASGGYYSTACGTLTNVTFAAGNFTADAGTWTVEEADQAFFEYMIVGNAMYVSFVINNTTISSSTPAYLKITLPAGKTAAAGFTVPGLATVGGVAEGMYIWGGTGLTYVGLTLLSGAAWQLGTNNTSVMGQFWVRF